MWGSARVTTSPSRSSTRRNTPWAEGCCGPKLTVMVVPASVILRRLLVAGQNVRRPFPGADKIENAEFLDEIHRAVDHSLQLFVVMHFDIAGQREILAQRMAREAVIGEQPAQIGMAGEGDAVHVEGFPLEPARRREKLDR